MEEALTAYLLGHAPLTALVGQRVNWARRPQAGALPAVVLHRIGGIPDVTMDAPSGLTQSRVQVDCWGDRYASTKAVARQVEARLSGARFVQSGITFQDVFQEGHDDSFEQGPGNTDLHRVSMDFLISHSG